MDEIARKKEMIKAKRQKALTDQIKEVSQKPVEKEYIKTISTGITRLDYVTCGGWPWGKIIRIVSAESGGKSYLATETIAHAKALLGDKLKWYYDDAEGGYSFDTQKKYGFEILDKKRPRSHSIEEFAGNFKSKIDALKKDECLIYVLDSLDGLSSSAERERDDKRQKAYIKGEIKDIGTYGMEKQKFTSEFFRLRAGEMHEKKVILFLLSQVRFNMESWGKQYKESGGKAADHYAHIILWLYEAEKHKKLGETIGTTIRMKAEKAKVEFPFRQAFIELNFQYGLDNIASNLNFLYDLKTDTGKDKKTDKKLVWDSQDMFERAKEELIQYIEDSDLEEELANRVTAKWEEIEAKISSAGRKSKWK